MADLNEVVGAVLRDLAAARVTGDLFSRDASQAYQADAILSSFPVPRVEIAQANIEIAFAITSVTKPTVDPKTVAVTVLPSLVFDLATPVYRRVLDGTPREDEVVKALDEQGIDLIARMTDALTHALEADPDALARLSDPSAGTDALQALVTPVLTQEFKDTGVQAILAKRVGVPEIRQRVGEASAVVLRDLAAKVEGMRPGAPEFTAAVAESADVLAARVGEDLVAASPRPEIARARMTELAPRIAETLRNGLAAFPTDETPRVIAGSSPRRRELDAALWTPLTTDVELRNSLVGIKDGELQSLVGQAVAPWLVQAQTEMRAAVKRAEDQAPQVGVAITSDELKDVPTERLSKVSITAGVSNLVWVAGEDGTRRLVSE